MPKQQLSTDARDVAPEKTGQNAPRNQPASGKKVSRLLAARRKEAAGKNRIHGLDALRAVAVVLVIIYHINASWAPGGFIGVDIFFVVSGFLITALLLREYRDRGRIDLKAFYIRRARRLIPAIVLVVAVATTLAALIGGDVLSGLGLQILGIFTFTANWVQLGTSFDYFNASQAGLFDNFWSLGIEEQFYLIWPVVLIAFLARGALFPRRSFPRMRINLIVIAAVSAALMGGLVLFGQSNVAYLSTFSHLYGLLLGAALAFSARAFMRSSSQPVSAGAAGEASGHASGNVHPPSPWKSAARTASRNALAAAMAGVGLAILGLLVFSSIAETPGREPVITLAGTLAGLLLVGACLIAGPAAWVFDRGVLGWIGTRSYGLYLWHFPMIVLADHFAATGHIPLLNLMDQTQVRPLAVVIAVIAAELSYRWVELPIRRQGFGHLVSVPGRAMASGLAVAVLVSSAVWAQAREPQQTTLQQALTDGQAYTDSFTDDADEAHDADLTSADDEANATSDQGATPSDSPSAAQEPSPSVDSTEDIHDDDVPSAPTPGIPSQQEGGESESPGQETGGDQAGDEAGEQTGSPDAEDGNAGQDGTGQDGAGDNDTGSGSEDQNGTGQDGGVQEDVDQQDGSDSEENESSPTPDAAPAPTEDPAESGGVDAQEEPAEEPEQTLSADMIAVGDSVMLASSAAMAGRFDVIVDAVESRQLSQTPDVVAQAVRQVPGASVVVIGVGINGVGGEAAMREAIANAGDRRVVLVNIYGPMSFTDSHNAMLHNLAASYGNVTVADWASRASDNTHCLQADNVHPLGECTGYYADAIAGALG